MLAKFRHRSAWAVLSGVSSQPCQASQSWSAVFSCQFSVVRPRCGTCSTAATRPARLPPLSQRAGIRARIRSGPHSEGTDSPGSGARRDSHFSRHFGTPCESTPRGIRSGSGPPRSRSLDPLIPRSLSSGTARPGSALCLVSPSGLHSSFCTLHFALATCNFPP